MNGLVTLTTGLIETLVLHGSTSQLSEARASSSYILHLSPLSPEGLLTSRTRHEIEFSAHSIRCVRLAETLFSNQKKHQSRCLQSFEDQASGILYQVEALHKHAHPDRSAAAFFTCLACTMCVHLTADMFSFGGQQGHRLPTWDDLPFFCPSRKQWAIKKETPSTWIFQASHASCVKEPL